MPVLVQPKRKLACVRLVSAQAKRVVRARRTLARRAVRNNKVVRARKVA